jgi:hypothetical protein
MNAKNPRYEIKTRTDNVEVPASEIKKHFKGVAPGEL